MCRDHFEALEADFQRYYQIDLASALYGDRPLGARRFLALIKWLPAEAAVWRATSTSWTVDNELAALNIEMLDSLRRMYIQAHTKKGTQPPKPVEVPRPWNTEKKSTAKRGTTLAEMMKRHGLKVRRGGDE